MSRLRTTTRRIGASAVLVTAAALATVTPAQAAPAAPAVPSSCTTELWSGGSRTYCRSGSGEYRATVRCDRNNGFDYNRYGSWVTPGRWSFADCDSGDRPFNAGAQLR